MDKGDLALYRDVFIQRADAYAQQQAVMGSAHRHVSYVCVRHPVTDGVLADHLAGRLTAAWYTLDVDGRCRWGAYDCDDANPEGLLQLQRLARALAGWGMVTLLEGSRRGGHLWALVAPPGCFASEMRALLYYVLEDTLGTGDGSRPGIEVYPKQNTLPRGGFGSGLRGPLGVHWGAGGRRFPFLDPETLEPVGRTLREQLTYLGQRGALRPQPEVISALAATLPPWAVMRSMGGRGYPLDPGPDAVFFFHPATVHGVPPPHPDLSPQIGMPRPPFRASHERPLRSGEGEMGVGRRSWLFHQNASGHSDDLAPEGPGHGWGQKHRGQEPAPTGGGAAREVALPALPLDAEMAATIGVPQLALLVRQCVDLHAHVARYARVEAHGRVHCPFHPPDEHPSFVIHGFGPEAFWICFHETNPATGRYLGGDVSDFHARMRGVPYAGAVWELATLYGILPPGIAVPMRYQFHQKRRPVVRFWRGRSTPWPF
jgi:hypothetical protein